MSLLAIKHIKFRHGERHKLLVCAQTGTPLYYPSLFITTQIRAGGFSVSTVQATLAAIKVLYAWQADQGINLKHYFRQGGCSNRRKLLLWLALVPGCYG